MLITIKTMMRNMRGAVAAWTVLVAFWPAVTLSQEYRQTQKLLTVAADEWCPINCNPAAAEFGNAGYGIGIDLAKAVFEPLGYKIHYVVMPWSRALELVRQGKVDAVVGANTSDEPTLIFPKSPIYYISDDFYVAKESTFTFRDINSLKGRRLGIIKDYGYDESINKYVKSARNISGAVQETSGEDALQQNIRKLLAGRIDVMVESRPVMEYMLKQMQLNDKVRWVGSIPQGNVYLGFSPALTHSAEMARIFDEGVARLRKEGKLGGMYAPYGITQ